MPPTLSSIETALVIDAAREGAALGHRNVSLVYQRGEYLECFAGRRKIFTEASPEVFWSLMEQARRQWSVITALPVCAACGKHAAICPKTDGKRSWYACEVCGVEVK